MAKQTINVGTAANDKKGDSLRAAFQKVNANFTELYTVLGINADGTLNLGAFEFTGSVMSTTDSSAIVIDQSVSVTSDLTVGGDVVPNIANGGDLGSLARPWKTLYVSNQTIYLGSVPLSLDANNNLTVNGSPVTDGGNAFNQSLNTGDSVTFNSVGATTVNVSQINGTNPGDELVIQANNHNWTFDTNGNLTVPQGTLLGYSDPGGFIINGAVDKDIAIYTYNGADAHGWTFGTDGSLTLPGDIRSEGNINIEINLADSTLRRWQFGEDGDLTLPNGGKFNNPYGDGAVNLSGNQDLYSALASYDTKSWAGVVDATYSVSDFGAAGGGFFIQTDVGVTNKTWAFRADGDLTLPAGGDILDSNGDSVLGGGSSTVVRQATPPTASNGTLWFNTLEGRLYIKYSDAWIDAAPLMTPAPDTDIDVASITFADASVQTTAFTGTALVDRLVNGSHEVVLNTNGDLLSANDIIAVPTGRFIKDCGNSGGTTSMRWTRVPTEQEVELIRIYTGDEENPDDVERAKISLEWQTPDQSGLSITAFDDGDEYKWDFKGDGAIQFPTLTVPISDNANPSGTGQTLKFSNSYQQAIIYGPSSTADNISAERVIIQGAPGYTGTSGEGGDVYLWAGPGGSTNGNGGDIKVRAGQANGTGEGGYLNFQAGDSSTGTGGYVNIESGSSNTSGQGGDITLDARSGGEIILRTDNGSTNNNWTFAADGNLTIPGDIRSEGNINIEVNLTDSTKYIWQFGEDGNLTLPAGGTILNSSGLPYVNGITSISSSVATGLYSDASGDYTYGTLSYDYAVNGITSGGFSIEYSRPLVGGNVDINVGNTIVNGDLTLSGDIRSEGNIDIDINLSDSTLRRWSFGEDGNLTLPAGGDIVDSNGTSVLGTTLYLLEAYASETYTLPGSFTEDVCRYSYISNTVNVSSAWFNTSTYRFTPLKAGYWEITAVYDVYRNSESSIAIKKNTTIVASAGSFNAVAQQITKIIYLNGSTDYIQIFNYGGAALERSQYETRSWFQARWVGA